MKTVISRICREMRNLTDIYTCHDIAYTQAQLGLLGFSDFEIRQLPELLPLQFNA